MVKNGEIFEVRHLKNGVPVLFVNYPDGQTVTIGISYNVGGRSEWKDQSLDGVSHFLEHQFFKGNPDINLTPLVVNEKLDALGGITNAFTTEDCTAYYSKSLSSEVYEAIELWDKLLQYGPINQVEFDKESFVVRQEFRRFEDNPFFLLYKTLKSELFKGTSLEMTVIGTEESLANVTLEQMENFRANYYGLENAVLMILGNYDLDKVYNKLNSTFGEKSTSEKRPSYQLIEFKPSSKTNIKKIHMQKEVPLVFFGMMVKTSGGKSKNIHALDIFMALLTLGKSSLLQKRLVRTGLCSFAASFTDVHEDVGSMVFAGGTIPDMYNAARDASMQMLHDALTMELTPEMLLDICNRIEYSLRAGYEDPMEQFHSHATGYWRRGIFESLEEYLESIRKISVEEVDKVRKEVLSHLDGVFGTLGYGNFEFKFPDGTWNGSIIE